MYQDLLYIWQILLNHGVTFSVSYKGCLYIELYFIMPEVIHLVFLCLYLSILTSLHGICLFFATWMTLCKT